MSSMFFRGHQTFFRYLVCRVRVCMCVCARVCVCVVRVWCVNVRECA